MPAYLITYDLSYADGQDYAKLIDMLNKSGAVRATESSWYFFSPTWTATQIGQHMKKFMHARDVLTVNEMTIGNNHVSYGLSPEAIAWRAKHLIPAKPAVKRK